MSTNSIYMTLGERIKYARNQKEMTQDELGKLIGISRSFVNHLETDRKKPSLETLIKLAKTLEVSLDFLAEEDVKLILRDFLPKDLQKEQQTAYAVVVDKAIEAEITPEDLESYIETIRRHKEKAQSR